MNAPFCDISGVCPASPMHVSDEQLESLWSKLVNKDGTRAPSDVVLAFASLGGSDAEAVYCTSRAEQQTEFWLVLAVDGDFLVYVSADGLSLWRGDEDRPAESLEAFAAPVRSYVSAVGIEETEVRGGDYGFGERRRPIAPWHPLWVLTKNRNSAAGAHQQCHLTCSFLDSRAHHTAPPSRAVTSAG
jgi:hypothetical protein